MRNKFTTSIIIFPLIILLKCKPGNLTNVNEEKEGGEGGVGSKKQTNGKRTNQDNWVLCTIRLKV